MSSFIGTPLNWAITTTAGAGFLLFGYDQGVMSGLLTGAAFTSTFPSIDVTDTGHGSSSLQGTVVAIYEIGCFFGCILTFLLGEKLGRRKCIMAGCLILTVGGALQASASTIPHLIVGRIVAGIGNGINTSTIPVWHSELTHAHSRGKGVCIELSVNIFGLMTAYWIDYGMSFVSNSSQFRFPLAFQCFFALFTLFGIIFLPESPRWLVAHDRHDEARIVLWSIEHDARHMRPDDMRVTHRLVEIQEAIREEREASGEASGKTGFASMKLLFKRNSKQRFLYRTMLGIGGQFMQQLSGINLISYYTPTIFQDSVGMTYEMSLLIAGFSGVAYFFSALVPIWIIDRVGRRKLMLFALAGQGMCMAVLAGTVSNGNTSAGICATVMLFLFNFFFSVGLLAIPWLLPPEYSPLAVRTPSASLASASNWIFTFLVVEITPVSFENIGWRTYIYFSVFNFVSLPVIYFFYPETSNLSLEQIDHLFTGDKIVMNWKASMGGMDASDTEAGGNGGRTVPNEKENEDTKQVHMHEYAPTS